ncbi:MAG TPA: ABC transporter ATP-binding protein, partial [Paenirhodobacter sp.]
MSTPILTITGLTVDLPKGGDRPHAVDNLSVTVGAGEIVCIVGESGSGKSITSFATMALLPKALNVSAGSIMFEGQDILKMSEAQHAKLRGNRMAMIFQEPMTALNPCYTVGDQIGEVFLSHTDMPKAERKAKTMALLEEVRMPDPPRIYGSFPHQLSGGQRQRIVIAMALALDPSLLIADEPTTALDVTTQAQILAMFRDLRKSRGAGIMLVTHDFDVVAEVADKVVVMQKGVVVEQGSAEEVLNRPQHPYTRQLIDAVPRRARDEVRAVDDKPVVLQVTDLEKTYRVPASFGRAAREVKALRPASFTLHKGETLGIVGESGSGKSTLVRTLLRLIDPTSGSVTIDGRDIAGAPKSDLRMLRRDIQIVFQDPYGSLNPRRTIGDQLIEGPLNFGVSRAKAMEKARKLVKIVRLGEEVLDRYPNQFSGGQRQRLCIARALMVEPRVLVADEAVSALDVSVQKEVLKLLAEIRDRMGLSMLFITHDLRVAAQICDNVIVMSQGEIVERGAIGEVFANPKHAYTKELLTAMPGQGWEVPDLSALPPATISA